MRNLRITSFRRDELDLQATPKGKDITQIRAIAVDPLGVNVYAATSSHSLTSSTLTDLDLWQLTPDQRHLSSFSAPLSRSDIERDRDQQVVSLDYLSDGGSFVNNDPALCIISAGGDIALLALNNDTLSDAPSLPEIVGSVEQGILAASWSPDEELLILVTAPTPAEMADDGRSKGSTLLIMTRDFEVLSEEALKTDEFGEERPITLGWGSKSTQFHGSEGKQAAEAASMLSESSTDKSSRGPLLEDDDKLPRISWRGDSNIFAVNCVEAYGSSHHRLIRTFSKSGSLLATSDPSSKGVSHVLAFKPTGILMATTQRTEEGHDLAFFERNGLPKGGFNLRDSQSKVKEVAWNCDGSLLAIWLEGKVQIWSTGNYHWYLKQEMCLDTSMTTMRWHSEQPFSLYRATADCVYSYRFTLDSCVSMSKTPHDAACTAVVDGNKILLTPFRIQIVPPPMSSMELILPVGQVPIDLAWTDMSSLESSASVLAVLLRGGQVVCYLLEWEKMGGKSAVGGRRLPTPKLICRFVFDNEARQVAVVTNRKANRLAIGVLTTKDADSLLTVSGDLHLEEMTLSNCISKSISLGKGSNRTLVASSLESDDLERQIYVHGDKQLLNVAVDTLSLPAFFPRITVIRGGDTKAIQVLGLTDSGRLYINDHLLAKDATSFALTDHNIIWTNASHEARFLPIDSLKSSTDLEDVSEPISLGRRVERGSRIVAAVPSTMSLVLQMPRGNLETVAPRPLVLEVIRRKLDEKRYGSAYRICRTHRLDMNLLVDYNRAAFLADVPLFVKQVQDSEYLNLFLSSLRQDDVTKTLYKPLGEQLAGQSKSEEVNKVNTICDSVRRELETMDGSDKYITTILTTYVRKSPPELESSLQLLQKLKEKDAGVADEACKYVIFLTNANKLFDAALGMYDFTLPLLVAHHSPRKDPREYLPFLRELRNVQPVELQRFRIDETLARWGKALSWIVKAGDEHFEQACRFVAAHELYSEALREYAGSSSKLKIIQDMYGDWLQERNRFKEAGILFALCGQYSKAIEADVKAGAWKVAFEIAAAQKIAKGEMSSLAKRVAASLSSYGRHSEAAVVAIDYLNDVEEGVASLCKDLEYSEANRIASLHGRLDLIETHIRPSLMEASETLLEELNEMSDQGHKQFTRLAELRQRKAEFPEDFHPEVDIQGEAIEGDDALSQAFTTFTRFTRYTAFTRGTPGSVMSGFTMNSKRTRKSRRKDAKKQQTGKKGTIYEEDYLFESIQRLLQVKLEKLQKDVGKVLVQFGRMSSSAKMEKHRRRGKDLFTALDLFEKSMKEQAEIVWKESKREEEEMEKQRLKAIEEAIQLGISWSQLQANGLFAPQLERKKIEVASVEWQLDLLQQL